MPAAKQQTSAAETPIPDFSLTEENLRKWFLGPYEKQKQVINDAKKKMKETEGESKMLNELLEQTLYYEESVLECRFKNILSLVINPKTGKFWDIPTLQGAGKLSDAEVEYIRVQHQGRSPPYYYIYQIQRMVDDQHHEWLSAQIMFEGIDKDGERVNRGWRIGYHNIPQLQWKYVSSDPQNANSTQIRIPQHNWRYFSAEEGGIRIYEMPYSKETFFAMMKHAQSQDPTDKSNGISLSFFKSGASNPMSIQSIEQFTTDNFEEEWEKLIAPPAAKDLKNFVEEFRKQNQTQNNSSQADFLKQFVEEFRRQSNNEAGGHGEHYQ